MSEGVALPEGLTASGFFHRVLLESAARFPAVLGDAGLSQDPSEFRKTYAEQLVRFEALRAASSSRAEIARDVVERTQAGLEFNDGEFRGPLREHLARPMAPAAIEVSAFRGRPGLRPAVRYRGYRYAGREIADLAAGLLSRHRMTGAAASALEWIATRADSGHGIDLSGQKFVVMGAAAEIAPTPLLLAAGASVLWVDTQDPAALLDEPKALAGSLALAQGARDLLREPACITATIAEFAAGDPVHLGLFAYAPGQSQEWRLAAAMLAIARALPQEIVRSLSLFVSPTTPLVIAPEDARVAQERAATPPAWQRALSRTGLLPTGGPLEHSGIRVARTIVPLQGLSYQAAQYVSKVLAAETCAIHGLGVGTESRPIQVSANVAGITRTRSMGRPIFEAAFLGARPFGVEVFEPETTRVLSGLLVLHDLLNPAAPGSVEGGPGDTKKRAARLFTQQIHGGVCALPYALEPAIRIAGVLGLFRRPTLLLRMLSSR